MLQPPCTPLLTGLNPCFSGCWSRTRLGLRITHPQVLILVLVDVGLGRRRMNTSLVNCIVLILVLVDVGLGRLYKVSVAT